MAENSRYFKEGCETRNYVWGIMCVCCVLYRAFNLQPTRRARDAAIIDKANLVAPYVTVTICFLMAIMTYGTLLQYQELVYLQSAVNNPALLVSLSLRQLMQINVGG